MESGSCAMAFAQSKGPSGPGNKCRKQSPSRQIKGAIPPTLLSLPTKTMLREQHP